MKKLLLGALVALSALPAMATLNGSGFYRVQNAVTKRYAYLLDNKGSFDVSTSSADVNALQLYSGFLKASSDPSTVFYLEDEGGNLYNIGAQGTDLYSFFGSFMTIISGGQYDGKQSYLVSASKSGFTKYLGDLRSDLSVERGYPSVEATGNYRKWYVDGISASGDNYFGIAPTVNVGNKYYQPFYAGFQYSPYSAGVKTYVVNRLEPEYGVVVLKEVTGKIYAGTPVIIECDNALATDNRLTVGPDGEYSSIPTNYLRGVFFDNDNATHYNRTPYDKNSMRSLANVNGKLMFVKGNHDFCPRNESYLQLPDAASCAIENWQVMKEDEFNEYVASLNANTPDGYYRMQNVASKRYVHILDNSGSASDAGALQLYADLLNASSDPASVMYVSRPAGSGIFDRHLAGQGTSTQSILGGTVSVTLADVKDGVQAYYVSTASGKLGDSDGKTTVGASGDASQWWINSIDNAGANHFGVVPTVTAGGKYYKPFMADFPVAASSEGVKFYTVTKVDNELEVMILTPVSGVIPAGTPVIVECANPLATDNRLTVGATGDAANVSGNLLKGVYYNIAESGHTNRTPYDKAGMRSLTAVDGKLVFAPSEDAFVPRNEAYILLSNDSQKDINTYAAVSQDEYDALVNSTKDLVSEGFYRMQNVSTGRNLFMLDSKGSLKQADNSDTGAFRTYSDILKAASDPASVFTVVKTSDNGIPEWNLQAQGTSFGGIFGSNVKFLPADDADGDLYAYTMKSGRKLYLSDADVAEGEGVLSTASSATSRRWTLNEVDAESEDSYFGVAPSVTANGKYYQPFIANFPIQPYSDGVKAYIIYKIDANNKAMVLREVDGIVPANNAVIIECANPLATDNRLQVGGNEFGSVKGNILKGVLIDSDIEGHVNHTAFDKDDMRVLKEVDGKLVMAKGDYDYVPRNQAYVQLGGTKQLSVDEYEVMTQEEYEARMGVSALEEDALVDVYHVDGSLVREGMPRSEVDNLPHGIYLLHSGDHTEKHLVH